jgi:serine/threonine protein kinase
LTPPTLTPGTRLGPYQVSAQIGAGGMGEVYRARDTKLNRDVAIKVLLAAMANDPDGSGGGDANKINWQSVLFLGYGDDRELSAERRLEHVDRQVFVKLSHAFQR